MEGSAEALALIRRFTGTRAPGLADRLGALPPFPSQKPSTRSHSGGLCNPDAPRHLGRPRSSCAGGSRPRESPGRGVLPRQVSTRGGVWPGSSGRASPQPLAPSCLLGAPCSQSGSDLSRAQISPPSPSRNPPRPEKVLLQEVRTPW